MVFVGEGIMFTGLVQTLATIVFVRAEPPGKRLGVCAPAVAAAARVGDSIAVNGCCLTVVEIAGETLAFEAAGPKRSTAPTWANWRRAAR